MSLRRDNEEWKKASHLGDLLLRKAEEGKEEEETNEEDRRKEQRKSMKIKEEENRYCSVMGRVLNRGRISTSGSR